MKRCVLFLLWVPLLAAGVVPGRYFVELTGQPVAEHVMRRFGARQARGAMRGAEARAQRARVRTEQRAARRSLEQEQATVLETVDTVANGLVVLVPDSRAAALARLPGVRRVRPVGEVRMLLDTALAVHHVPEAWSLAGFDNAGAGVKIAIIDSGIEVDHPGFQDPSLTVPAGFPKVTSEGEGVFTNNKVIVARSYAYMFRRPDPDGSPRDRVGHGTAAAMAAAGVRNSGPLATITGVAPKAWLGNYKVFGSPSVNDRVTDDVVVKAIDDAVADGMDVINLSLGDDLARRMEDDIKIQAVERASAAGVIVVVAAGNSGPDAHTISSPATAPSVIAAGASSNGRMFSSRSVVHGLGEFRAINGSGAAPAGPVSGSLFDVFLVDQSGLACEALPPNSLAGRIAFIARGVCTFEEKLNFAQRAGAAAALVYTDRDRPEPVTMTVGSATLPAQMVGYENGLEIKAGLASPLEATLHFARGPVFEDPDRLADFSAKGPEGGGLIKPDLVAVGTSLYTAAQRLDPQGSIFHAAGYATLNGTSFSAPLVAGAAAVLKAARPGLSTGQYRSLLVNSAAPLSLRPGVPATAQQAGAGSLDLRAALTLVAAATPVSVSFGSAGAETLIRRSLTIANTGTAPETFLLSVVPRTGGPAPELSRSTVDLVPGDVADVGVTLHGAGAGPGEYEGFIAIQAAASGSQARVPYWFGVPSKVPRNITIVDTAVDPRPAASLSDAVLFRVTDASGISLRDIEPTVTVVSGGGEVTLVRSRNVLSPGLFGINVRTGQSAGPNVFRIAVGETVRTVTVITK